MKERGFSGFDGGKHDFRPVERRMEIKKHGVEGSIFDNKLMLNEAGEIDQELVLVESYTLSAFMIEKNWKHFKARGDVVSKEDSERIPLDDNFWKNFIDYYMEIEEPTKEALSKQLDEFIGRPEETWSSDEKMIARFFYVQSLKENERGGIPSYRDFISIHTRLARVAGERFQEQNGRELTREEYEHILSDKSFQNIMLQMMMNSRPGLMPVMKWLEGKEPDLDDLSGRWLPECFDIVSGEDGKPILKPKEEGLQILRAAIQKVMIQFREQGKKMGPILRCPVLSTGIFSEMCDWLRGEFAHHYLDQKYGKTS